MPDGQLGYSIRVAGIPVGDHIFVKAILDEKAQDAMSTTDSVVGQLRDAHIPRAWTALYYALQPKFHHYWLQHCYPADCQDQATIKRRTSMLASFGLPPYASLD